MSTRLIVNADDFGLSPAVNRGIVEAHRHGILTSTTLMANMEFFDDAVRLAAENTGLGVGAHLSLLWGSPLSDPAAVPSLVGGSGRFLSGLGALAGRWLGGRLRAGDVDREFRAQLRRIVDAGIQPTHVDTHKHIHCLPPVLEGLLRAAGAFGIVKLRIPDDRPLAREPRPSPTTPLATRTRLGLLRPLLARMRRRAAAAGMASADRFAGIRLQHALDGATLMGLLRALPPGSTELMCHPGRADEHLRRWSRTPPNRPRELEGLLDPSVKAYVSGHGIELINYGDL